MIKDSELYVAMTTKKDVAKVWGIFLVLAAVVVAL